MPKRRNVQIGDKYNMLTVVEIAGRTKRNVLLYKCLCDCGNYKITQAYPMVHNTVKSCGCTRFKPIPKIGDVFNRLTVVGEAIVKSQRRYYPCVCECGKTKDVERRHLYSGNVKSCGCAKEPLSTDLAIELKKLIGKRYNYIVITDVSYSRRANKLHYICDCGKTGQTTKFALNKIISCGCTFEKTYSGYQQVSGTYMASLRFGANCRNREFNITPEDIWDVYLSQDKKCALSGQEIVFNRKYYKDYSLQTASVDRIDSEKGYTKDNIQIVHKDINMLKQDFEQEYFIDMCKKIAEHQTKKDNK